MLGAINDFFKDAEKVAEHLDEGSEDVFVIEYRALSILNKFHDDFDKTRKKLNTK